MNTLTIILAVIVIILSYYIYTIITAVPVIVDKADLTTNQSPVNPTKISNPYSANYTIGTWVYIVNFNSTIGTFLTYGDNANKTIFSLTLNKDTPKLTCNVLTNNGLQSVSLTAENDTFPVQKWVYVVVSVSNFIECYLNGQFINAVQVDPSGLKALTPPKDVNLGATFSFGQIIPVVLAGVSRWETPLSSAEVYNNYSKGNGLESSLFGPGYKINVNVTHGKRTYNIIGGKA